MKSLKENSQETPISGGKLIKSTKWFSKMDPYVIIETREQKLRSKTKQSAGKTPVWNEVSLSNFNTYKVV